MPRDKKNKASAAPPPPPPAASATPGAAAAGNPSMAPRGQFNRRQEGQRFLTPLQSIAPNPRNLREEWEYETDEFEEFKNNVENTELIQDPAVCSVDAFTAKYQEHANAFGPEVEWVLLAGERRYKALLGKKAGTDSVPVVLRDTLLQKGDFVLLSENNFRKGWDPIQEATLLARIRREEGLTYDEILEKLGGEQSAIKRRSDISKRMKLLELQDGPLRRAIREGKVGLEPAYTLVSRLKEPELIEQAWALMQADEVTAKVACDTLLGKTQAPAQVVSETDSNSGTLKEAHELPEGGDTASASGEGSGAPERTAEQQDGAAPGGGEQQAAEGREITPTPPESPEPPASSEGLVDEIVGTNDVKVPNQQGSSSELSPIHDSPAPAETERPTDDAASENEQDVNARLQACTKVLSASTWMTPDAVMRRVAVHTLLEATHQAFDLAAQIAGRGGLTDGNRFRYVAALEAADDGGILTMAYAVALATDELHLRSVGNHLDARAAEYLKHLHDGVGFDITGYQSALEAISSAKL
ncbi:ParB/RepB/Spo0J family partition protein [Streptomyces sp. NPDC087532]|uniref:ParB/RepB/Spo0J family partition protein n=1 Tax=Streptomyces sp. NPDC087532 TaxID=3365795 RepID=UPI0037FF2819